MFGSCYWSKELCSFFKHWKLSASSSFSSSSSPRWNTWTGKLFHLFVFFLFSGSKNKTVHQSWSVVSSRAGSLILSCSLSLSFHQKSSSYFRLDFSVPAVWRLRTKWWTVTRSHLIIILTIIKCDVQRLLIQSHLLADTHAARFTERSNTITVSNV